uniref:Uncharacterized protein n=1 Tax=Micrurus spixii TaxID=129469 RepID=A0A2D4NDF6_9SAUR
MFEGSLTIVYYDRDFCYNSAPFYPLNNIIFEIYLLIRLPGHATLTLISIGKLKKPTRSSFSKKFFKIAESGHVNFQEDAAPQDRCCNAEGLPPRFCYVMLLTSWKQE